MFFEAVFFKLKIATTFPLVTFIPVMDKISVPTSFGNLKYHINATPSLYPFHASAFLWLMVEQVWQVCYLFH